jgi:hypothetical protein
LDLSVSELMRRAAFACEADATGAGWGRLADSAKAAADRAISAVEDALSAMEASERRLPALTLRDPDCIMMHRL